MKFEDDSQNVRARIRIVYVMVLIILVALGVRLYYLQVVKGSFYSERAENQRIRLLPIPAPRGAIFDRNGQLLVNSRLIYNVILSRDLMQTTDALSMVETLADGLQIDHELLRERIEDYKKLPPSESIKIKENATPADIAWVKAHAVEYPDLRIEEQPQRTYMENGVLAHVIGYVNEISSVQLERPAYKSKGYKPGDVIGQEGLEAKYDEFLRGRDGYRRVIVDSRGNIQSELETVPPQPGQDLVTTLDLDLQLVAEEQLRNSPSKRGVIVAMDPNNGELLVMASYPTFDPNLFSHNTPTKEMRRQRAALFNDPQRALYNRAIRGRYPPGSTWKIPMAASGLMQGVITIKDSNITCGGGIQTGNKFTRCMGNHGTPELRYAIPEIMRRLLLPFRFEDGY
ncbi:MAG: penicillin-binding transpeptidase domain-containing protein [Pyrinomonadaceae bacterium]